MRAAEEDDLEEPDEIEEDDEEKKCPHWFHEEPDPSKEGLFEVAMQLEITQFVMLMFQNEKEEKDDKKREHKQWSKSSCPKCGARRGRDEEK